MATFILTHKVELSILSHKIIDCIVAGAHGLRYPSHKSSSERGGDNSSKTWHFVWTGVTLRKFHHDDNLFMESIVIYA